MVQFLRAALSGEKVTMETPSFKVRSFKLGVRPEQPVPILIAALREGMLKLAGRDGDGAIINWLGADDVKTVAPIVQAAGDGSAKEVVARIFVAPSDDADTVRGMGRFAIAAYLNVPVYAAFHEWLGRGEILADMWRLWKEGDRKAALGRHPRPGRRRPHRVGPAREVPRARPALRRQRRHHPRPRHPPLRHRHAPGHPRPRPEVDPNVCVGSAHGMRCAELTTDVVRGAAPASR